MSRPNVLLVVSDDQGRWSVGPYGNREIRTPVLDRLAAQGWVMERAYSPSGVCSPARASLFTGRLPSQHGVHDFLSESIEHEVNWLEGEVLLPELLQGEGYRTGLFGKWHATPDPVPPQRGFDRWLSYDVFRFGWQNQYLHEGQVAFSDEGESVLVTGHQADHLTQQALEFIAESGDEPWFAFVGYAAPHFPFEGYPERLVESYRDVELTSFPRGESTHLEPANEASVPPEDPSEIFAQYAAGVTFLDEQLGRLVAELERRGELDDTLVVFTSDHGQMMGHHGLVGKANASLPQNLYRETMEIPMVLHWPAGLPESGRSKAPFDLVDLFATVLDAVGVKEPEEETVRANRPGRSVLAKLADPELAWRQMQYAEHGTVRAIVGPRYKLVVRYGPLPEGHGDELYDLVNDPRETRNRIADEALAEVRETLRSQLDENFDRYSEPGRAGSEALSQSPQNGNEPWRRLALRAEE
ncbi:MAG: sulfatase-like hydrolase/transferase [Acidobacteriota bacterium]